MEELIFKAVNRVLDHVLNTYNDDYIVKEVRIENDALHIVILNQDTSQAIEVIASEHSSGHILVALDDPAKE